MSCDLSKPMRGRVWKFGDSIDTDCISPFYLYPDPEELKKHVMESARPEFAGQVKPGDIVVAGRNFGCGSARNAKALYALGIAAIVADSFSTLFLRNAISGGDLLLKAPGVSSFIEDGQSMEINYPDGVLKNLTTGKSLPIPKYPSMIEELYRIGGILPYAKVRYDAQRKSA